MMVDHFLTVALALDEVPADTLRHFAVQGLGEEVQRYLDAEVLAGRFEALPDGTYRKTGEQR